MTGTHLISECSCCGFTIWPLHSSQVALRQVGVDRLFIRRGCDSVRLQPIASERPCGADRSAGTLEIRGFRNLGSRMAGRAAGTRRTSGVAAGDKNSAAANPMFLWATRDRYRLSSACAAGSRNVPPQRRSSLRRQLSRTRRCDTRRLQKACDRASSKSDGAGD